jgi:hypothetical protein
VLLRHGADPAVAFPHRDPLLGHAIRVPNAAAATALLHHGLRASPRSLYDAAGSGVAADPLAGLLLESGACVDWADDRGWRALAVAASVDDEAAVNTLLHMGADATARTARGETPRDLVPWRRRRGAVVRALAGAGDSRWHDALLLGTHPCMGNAPRD